jgi:hypothetical protein
MGLVIVRSRSAFDSRGGRTANPKTFAEGGLKRSAGSSVLLVFPPPKLVLILWTHFSLYSLALTLC